MAQIFSWVLGKRLDYHLILKALFSRWHMAGLQWRPQWNHVFVWCIHVHTFIHVVCRWVRSLDVHTVRVVEAAASFPCQWPLFLQIDEKYPVTMFDSNQIHSLNNIWFVSFQHAWIHGQLPNVLLSFLATSCYVQNTSCGHTMAYKSSRMVPL